MTLTAAQLDEIEALSDSATAGPWDARIWMEPQWLVVGPNGPVDSIFVTSQRNDEDNARFIARLSPEVVRELCRLARIGIMAEPSMLLLAKLKRQERQAALG
jgi:hypothetical protein